MLKKILVLTLALFCLCGCLDQKMEEDSLRQNIGEILEKYQRGVNNLDNSLLKDVISEQFSFYDQKQADYIQKLLAMTVLIDNIAYANIQVENYKIFCDVNINGNMIYKPQVEIPVFKDQLPFIQGQFKKQAVFAFAYEKAGLMIIAEDTVLISKNFFWGQAQPEIINPLLSATRVSPGDVVDISFKVNKGRGNDVVFVFINDQQIGGYALTGYDPDNEVTYKLKIPADYAKGSNYDINLTAIAGKVNLTAPQESVLQGIAVTGYSIPVR